MAANTQPAAAYTPLRKMRAKSRAESGSDPLPSAALTEEVMFKYLAAEIADQRGDWQTAYATMVGLAQQTRDPRIARRAAEIALNAKQGGEALAAVRLWRELAPHSEEATQYYLGFLVLEGDLAEARPILEQRLKDTRQPLQGSMIMQMQRLLARTKDKAAAFSLLENLLEPYKSLMESHLALAQAAFLNGDHARAVQEARHALAANPGSELAALTLAQVIGDKDESAASLASFLKANPKAREVRLAYARMLVEQKKYDESRNQFKILQKEDPQDLTVLYALGLLSAQNNDLKEAEAYLTNYLKILSAQPNEDRDPTQALLVLSQIAEQRNDTKTALKWLEQIEPATPQAYLGAQIKRAQLIARDGNTPAARKLLQSVNVDGDDEKVQLVLAEAQILRNANQMQEAVGVLENGLKRYPDQIDLLYDYAMLAEKMNRLGLMENLLRKIISLAPDNQQAYNALGYSLAERNMRLDEAFNLIQKALQLAPEDPFIMDSMGWVQFRMGKLKEAETMLRQAYQLRPDPEIGVHLGEVLWVVGQREAAKKLWRDANTKDPKNDTLRNTLTRLQVRL